jgi:hypothetical protein
MSSAQPSAANLSISDHWSGCPGVNNTARLGFGEVLAVFNGAICADLTSQDEANNPFLGLGPSLYYQ